MILSIETDPGTLVLDAVKAALANGLAQPNQATKFAACGGVLITTNPREMLDWIGVGIKRPFLFVEIADIRNDEIGGTDKTRWLIQISIEAITLAAAAPFDAPLKSAVIAILDTARATFNALGIEETTIRAGQGNSPNPERINPHTFECAVHIARI